MKLIMRLLTVLLVAVFVTGVSGCAIFKGDAVPAIDSLPASPSQANKPSVSYSFTSWVQMKAKRNAGKPLENKQKSDLTDALQASNYFSSVQESKTKGDVHIDIDFMDRGNPAALVPAVITGLSLYTIPSWAKARFEMTAKAVSARGKQKTYTINDSIVLVQWLPMMFVFPFTVNNPKIVRTNMYNNMLLQMHQDGFFR